MEEIDYSLEACLHFWDYQIASGCVSKGSGGQIKQAVKKLLRDFTPESLNDLRGVDLDHAIRQYKESHTARSLSPATLYYYGLRAQRGVTEFVNNATSPASSPSAQRHSQAIRRLADKSVILMDNGDWATMEGLRFPISVRDAARLIGLVVGYVPEEELGTLKRRCKRVFGTAKNQKPVARESPPISENLMAGVRPCTPSNRDGGMHGPTQSESTTKRETQSPQFDLDSCVPDDG